MDPSTEARRRRVLDAAFRQLRLNGYAGTSMLAIARAAGASKETLYRYFGHKRGLFAALVRANASRVNLELAEPFAAPDAPIEQVLQRVGRQLLSLLLGERAVVLNRAAIAEAATSTELSEILAEAGRGGTGPLLVSYLDAQRERGRLSFDSADEAFEVFLGLLLRDRQVRLLLGVVPPPSEAEQAALAARATSYFLRLFAAGPEP